MESWEKFILVDKSPKKKPMLIIVKSQKKGYTIIPLRAFIFPDCFFNSTYNRTSNATEYNNIVYVLTAIITLILTDCSYKINGIFRFWENWKNVYVAYSIIWIATDKLSYSENGHSKTQN